jgi:thiol peroxidase
MDRYGAVTLKGNPVTLVGAEVKVGQRANDFSVLDNELKEKTLADFKGKIKLIASVPSLDTPVCDTEIKRFNDEASRVSKDLVIIFISMDLPFAQKRFCQEFEINKIKTLSDHKSASFGVNYGVLIKELRLLARAIFLVDKDDNVVYVEYVKEVGMPPNYDAALNAIKKIKVGKNH